ncbi:MAG: alcohol dehydrogenase [Dehalococcoidia bacterium]|jgi:L-gulonate 5-dehydrogenase|nr:MAG: alcohol dehydrogenase [Dehalococcoidia bacterium]
MRVALRSEGRLKKALAFGPRDVRLVDLAPRTPGPGEVRARMLMTTLTTANVRLYTGPLMADVQYPVTLSYTGVAEVAEVGRGVTRVRPGDLVYPNFYRACLRCRFCRADRMVACEQVPLGAHNMMIGEAYESALQSEIVLGEERMNLVPAGTPLEAAAMTGFFSVAMQAIVAVEPDDRDPLFVNGAGPIGWCATQLAKLHGSRVVIAEVLPARMERARQFGADVVIDARQPDARQQVVEACGGAPLKIVEATGTAEGSALAFDVAGRGARIAAVGVSQHPITQTFIVLKGLRIDGIGGAIRVPEVIRLIAEGKIDISASITHRFPLARLVDALELKRTSPEAELVAVYIDEARLPGARPDASGG